MGRALAAVLLGLAGWCCDVPVTILEQPLRVSFVLGSVLPMLAAMAWGGRYGLLAATVGLGGQWCWWVWPENGWANLPTVVGDSLWFAWIGWAVARRGQRRWWSDPYVAQGVYGLAYALWLLTAFRWSFAFNPAPWAPAAPSSIPAEVVDLIVVKTIINGFLVVLTADLLLLLMPVRRAFGLAVPAHHRHDTAVATTAMAVSLALWVVEALAAALAHGGGSWSAEVLRPGQDHLLPRLLLVVVCLAGGVAVARLVRRRVRLGIALEEGERRFRQLFSSMDQGVVYLGADGAVVEANPAARRMLALAGPGARLPLERLRGDDGRPFPAGRLPTAVAVRTGAPAAAEVVGLAGADGEEPRWLRLSAVPWGAAAGGAVAIISDITDLQCALAAQRAREEDLRITLRSIGDAVIATDNRGLVVRMNPAAEAMTGCDERSSVGAPLAAVFPVCDPASGAPLPSPVEAVMAEGAAAGTTRASVLRARDGSRREIAESAAPIRRADGGIVGVVLVFRDVTDRTRLEERLRQAQRLEALGQLAGGIAHDFNNMLAAIIGAAELLERRTAGNDAARQPLEMVKDAAAKAADLTGKLLGFSRKARHREEEVDLHAEMRAVAAILERTVDRRIVVECRLEARHHRFTGDPSQIQNAVLNLALNARDAMPQGGRLVLSTADLAPGDPLLAGCDPALAEHHLRLQVADTGSGLPDEVRAHLFEPFVTTKPTGKGTGLGLASVYGTVCAHHGTIAVESAAGQGTVFTIVLPVVRSRARHPGSRPGLVPSLDLGGLTVLIADDEEFLRVLLSQHLVEMGARVLQASDGDQAVGMFLRHGPEIGLVVLDQVMPNRSGAEAFAEIHARRPELPVVIASGYAADASITALLGAGLAGFLAKPYRREELVRLLAECLGRVAGAASP